MKATRHLGPMTAALMLTAACVTSGKANAFAGAPHWTATKSGLGSAGFDESAARRVYIAANEVDYMKNLTDQGSAAVPYLGILAPLLTPALLKWSDKLKAEATKLSYFHFDLLMTPIEVERYVGWLERGTEQTVRAIMKSGKSNDVKVARLLDALGISLHAIQDLYAHSTLAAQDWNAWIAQPYPTYDEIPEEVRRSPLVNLQSGDCAAPLFERGSVATLPGHGNGSKTSCIPYGTSPDKYSNREACGYNKDTARRPNHARAMYMTLRATEQWAKKVEKWIGNDAIWKAMKTFPGAPWVTSCYNKAVYTGSGARAWSYSEADYSIPTTLYGLGIVCDDGWEDAWMGVLNEIFQGHGRPDDHIGKAGDEQGKFAIHQPWDLGGKKGKPALDRKGGGTSPKDFVGKFKGKFGSNIAMFDLSVSQQSPDELTGTFTIPGGTFPIRGLVNGPSLEFLAGPQNAGFIGHVHLMNHGKKAFAGTITRVDEGKPGHGIPTGLFATKQ